MARVMTCFFRQISWASRIHLECFFPVNRGKVIPRDQYQLGWVLCTLEIPNLVGLYPMAILTQVRVPETHIREGTPPQNAQEWSRNWLDPTASQPDSTPTPDIQRDISADNQAVPFPLLRIPRILLHVERPAISLQQVALGGSNQDPEGEPQSPP